MIDSYHTAMLFGGQWMLCELWWLYDFRSDSRSGCDRGCYICYDILLCAMLYAMCVGFGATDGIMCCRYDFVVLLGDYFCVISYVLTVEIYCGDLLYFIFCCVTGCGLLWRRFQR
jgi:hypothetical protein